MILEQIGSANAPAVLVRVVGQDQRKLSDFASEGIRFVSGEATHKKRMAFLVCPVVRQQIPHVPQGGYEERGAAGEGLVDVEVVLVVTIEIQSGYRIFGELV